VADAAGGTIVESAPSIDATPAHALRGQRCVVFGASGAIGRFLVPRLIAAGADVVAVSRVSRASDRASLRWLDGHLPDRVPPLANADVVFSTGPLDAFAAWLGRGASVRLGGARIVAISSMSAESKRDSIDAAEQALATRLVDAERSLAAEADVRGAAWTILRPTLVYGAGLDRTLTPIARFASRWRVFPYIAGASGLRQPVHADDLAAACIAAATHDATARRRYGVGGALRVPFSAMMRRVRAALGVATVPLPVPIAVARAGVGVARKLPAFRAMSPAAIERLRRDLVADDAAARRDFGWEPRGFAPTVADWREAPLP
jgi:nucleoside-diphosphate-sugar epimerase